MGQFSLVHWLIIAVVLLVFFGPSRLPQLGQSLGEAIRNFKKSLDSSGGPESAASEKLDQGVKNSKTELSEKQSADQNKNS